MNIIKKYMLYISYIFLIVHFDMMNITESEHYRIKI